MLQGKQSSVQKRYRRCRLKELRILLNTQIAWSRLRLVTILAVLLNYLGFLLFLAVSNSVAVGQDSKVSQPEPEWTIDLDIDSDSNNGFENPDFSSLEDEIEDSLYSHGKLLEVGSSRLTPVRLRIHNKIIQLGDDSLNKLRIRFDWNPSTEFARLWRMPEGYSGQANGLGNPIPIGVPLSFAEIGLDLSAGTTLLWIEPIKAIPGLETFEAIKTSGRPDLLLRATITGDENSVNHFDEVKLMVVQPDTFFTILGNPNARHLRSAIVSLLVNGMAEGSGSAGTTVAVESKALGFHLISEVELKELLIGSQLTDEQVNFCMDVVFSKKVTFAAPSRSGVPGLQVGLYRDFNTGSYTLAFRSDRSDNCLELYNALSSSERAERFFKTASGGVEVRVKAMLLGSYFSSITAAGCLFETRLAGITNGGEVAVFGMLGSGLKTDVFNVRTLPTSFIEMVSTREDTASGSRKELVPGSNHRIANARDFLNAYELDVDTLQTEPSNLPVVYSQ